MSEQNFFLGRIGDLIDRESRGETMVFSGFLTPEEVEEAARICRGAKAPFMLWGGYDDAERKMLAVSSVEVDILKHCFPFVLIQFQGDVSGLTNRDVLGSLMGCGIRRDVLGDIIVRDGLALVFVADHIKDFILSNISSIGRKTVKAVEMPPDFDVPERRYEAQRLTVPSMRVDAVVSAITHVSRDQACRLIDGKLVAVNHATVEKKIKEVHAGDRIIVRGYGKWLIDSCDTQTRKGRTVLNCRKYI